MADASFFPDVVTEVDWMVLKDQDEVQAITITTFNDAGTEIPMDLTGYAIEQIVTPIEGYETIIARLSTANGTIVIDNAAGGLVHWSIPAGLMDGWPEGRFFQITRASKAGHPVELNRGEYVIRAAPTSSFLLT